jgi:ketopantoate reductase (EC 1.1.1.169)
VRPIQNRLQPGCQIVLLQNGMGSSRRWSTGCPVWAVAIPLFPVPPQQQTEAVAQATGDNFPSMLQDVRYRRPTEIERITGYLCARASH